MKKSSEETAETKPCATLKELFNQPKTSEKVFDQNSLAGRNAALKQLEKETQTEAFEKIAKFAVSPEEALSNFQVNLILILPESHVAPPKRSRTIESSLPESDPWLSSKKKILN